MNTPKLIGTIAITAILVVTMAVVLHTLGVPTSYTFEALGFAGFLLGMWNLCDKKVPLVMLLATIMAYAPYAQADNKPRFNPNPPPQYRLVADGLVPVSVMMFVKSEIDKGTLKPFYPDSTTACVIIVSMVVVAGVVVFTVHYICNHTLGRQTNRARED